MSSSSQPSVIGTPFPRLESNESVQRHPDYDQTVRDEHGRRRFHGAFTGGFSAGYWNTVGSAEGFTPKIFRSSRNARYNESSTLKSKPEDFMDDEDFSAFGIAPKTIHTKDDFVENFSFTAKDSFMSFDDVIRSIFHADKQSIGARLYRQMKYRATKAKQSLIDEDDNTADDDQSARPSDPRPDMSTYTKNDRHGLGYQGMLATVEDSKMAAASRKDNSIMATMKGGKRLNIKGEAFGYGALEDGDDDIVDLYSNYDMSNYDFEIGAIDERPSSSQPKKKKSMMKLTNSIEGFQRSSKDFGLYDNLKQKYPLPKLPKGWKPKSTPMESTRERKSRWDDVEAVKSTVAKSADANRSKPLNSNLRAVILGENVVHQTGVAKSAEPAKPNDDQRQPPKLSAPSEPAKPRITPLNGLLASKFTHGAAAAVSSSSSTSAASAVNIDDDDDHLTPGLNTFETISSKSSAASKHQAARKGSTFEDAKNAKPIRTTFEWHPHKLLCKRFGLKNPYPTNDFVGIVCMNHGDKSLNMLARLNKNQSATFGQFKKAVNIFDHCNTTAAAAAVAYQIDDHRSADRTTATESPAVTLTKSSSNEDEDSNDNGTTSPEPIEPSKPSIDLFKSIFESDADDDDDGDDINDNNAAAEDVAGQSRKDVTKEQEKLTSKVTVQSSVVKNDKPSRNPQGIFTNIDFDALNAEFDPRLAQVNSGDEQNKQAKEADKNSEDDDEYYGPVLPPSMSKSSDSNNRMLSSVKSNTTDNHEHRHHHDVPKHKHRKRSRKSDHEDRYHHKSNKSSNKHKRRKIKHKRKSSTSSSSSSSASSDNDQN